MCWVSAQVWWKFPYSRSSCVIILFQQSTVVHLFVKTDDKLFLKMAKEGWWTCWTYRNSISKSNRWCVFSDEQTSQRTRRKAMSHFWGGKNAKRFMLTMSSVSEKALNSWEGTRDSCLDTRGWPDSGSTNAFALLGTSLSEGWNADAESIFSRVHSQCMPLCQIWASCWCVCHCA